MYNKKEQIEIMKKTVLGRLKTECHENGISYLVIAAVSDDGEHTEWYADGIPAGEFGLRLSDDRIRHALLVLNGLDDLMIENMGRRGYAAGLPDAEKVAEERDLPRF